MRGNGLLAVRINSIATPNSGPTPAGSNPFSSLAFTVDDDRARFKEYMKSGWEFARDVSSMPLSDVAYDLGEMDTHTLSNLFPIYDWDTDDGRDNLGGWIEEASPMRGTRIRASATD